jgi:hypothetical protein
LRESKLNSMTKGLPAASRRAVATAGSNPHPGPLSFDVLLTGITIDSFIANGDGYSLRPI